TRAGTLDSRSGEIAARALEFGDLAASAVMVPRNRMTALSLEASVEDMRKLVVETAIARLPVYHGSPDTIVGYATTRDLAHGLLQGRLTSVADVLRPTHFVPRSTKAIHVLKELQRRQMQLAVVVDEHGGVSGVLTLEDLIEELVGEVLAEDEQPEQRIHVESERVVLVAGSTPIRDVNRQLDLDLPEDGEGTTIAGLCIELAGDLPSKGARITDEAGITFEIVSATSRSVSQVRMELPPKTDKTELDE
ncbi:MAG: CBS domain-containing protein, partial [Deltaproteobacteria bacterium]|nr:CBS domain-containing protein [Deltaproteobacteria bacterium]